MANPARRMIEPHLWSTPAVDISFAQMLARLTAAGVNLVDLNQLPGDVSNHPVVLGKIILDAHFLHRVLTKEEARYLLIHLTNIPDETLRQMIDRLDAGV